MNIQPLTALAQRHRVEHVHRRVRHCCSRTKAAEAQRKRNNNNNNPCVVTQALCVVKPKPDANAHHAFIQTRSLRDAASGCVAATV